MCQLILYWPNYGQTHEYDDDYESYSVLLFSPVHFRYIVFRPVIDEILVGKVKSCSKEGINGEWEKQWIASVKFAK